ncbi:Kv channel-interacting protein 4 [Dermatophagoides farinae]|nr:Kv channel-interacting protein 4 [Dermatophagoides farinae]
MIYRGFKQEAPSGVVREDSFKHIYSQFFPKGADVNQYAHYVFNTFDPERTGIVTFTDFVIGLSVLSRGTIQDKLKWIFSLYDVNCDGVISKDDLSRVIISVYDLLGKSVQPQVDESTYKQHIDRVFKKLDLNNDGIVTYEIFVEACKKDDDLLQSFDVFNTLL